MDYSDTYSDTTQDGGLSEETAFSGTQNSNTQQEDLGSGRRGVTQTTFSTGPKAGQTVTTYGRNSQHQIDSRRDAESIRDAMMSGAEDRIKPNINKINFFTVNKNPRTTGLQKTSIYGPLGPKATTIQSYIDNINAINAQNVKDAKDAKDAAQQPQSFLSNLMGGFNIGNVNVSPSMVSGVPGVSFGMKFAKGGPVGIASLRRR